MKFVFDFSKYIDHFFLPSPTGISRVDLEFARFLAGQKDNFSLGLHRRFGISTRFSGKRLQNLIDAVEGNWKEEIDYGILSVLKTWLGTQDKTTRRIRRTENQRQHFYAKCFKLALNWPWHDFRQIVPKGAFYINASYANTKVPQHLAWLTSRPDLTPVFMVHDLIPLASPDLFWDRLRGEFPKQIDTIFKHARVIVTPSDVVSAQVRALAMQKQRNDILVHTIALPPARQFVSRAPSHDADAVPYFVICGTIEPRKNHLLLLELWRKMANELTMVPKLVVVGQRGWKNEAVFSMLEQDLALAGHVLEVSDLSTFDLVSLIAGARALLMPSIDEGFGLPVAEALAIGTPVITSDIPVFREVSGGFARFCKTNDEVEWKSAILDLAFNPKALAEARAQARRFQRRTWDDYFNELTQFLDKCDRNKD